MSPIALRFPRVKPSTSLREAARGVLAARVAEVEYRLKRLRRGVGLRSSEDVHQLRVATRRLAAALATLDACFESDASARLRRAAKKLRRAAGEVRDRDVQRAQLEARPEKDRATKTAVMRLLRQCAAARHARARDLEATLRRWSPRFVAAAADTLASFDSHGNRADHTLATAMRSARTTLRKREKQVSAAGRRDLRNLDNLHRLRIAAKRLRYAMEVFAACDPRAFRRGLRADVERLQDDLGELNDLRNLAVTVRSWEGRRSRLSRAIKHDLRRRHARFRRRWTAKRQRKFHRRLAKALKEQSAPS